MFILWACHSMAAGTDMVMPQGLTKLLFIFSLGLLVLHQVGSHVFCGPPWSTQLLAQCWPQALHTCHSGCLVLVIQIQLWHPGLEQCKLYQVGSSIRWRLKSITWAWSFTLFWAWLSTLFWSWLSISMGLIGGSRWRAKATHWFPMAALVLEPSCPDSLFLAWLGPSN